MKKRRLFIYLFGLIFITNQGCKKNSGCTNPEACNYDADAVKDDGSCDLGTLWYLDEDGDGEGNPEISILSCAQPEGYVSNNTDLNDILVLKKQRATVTYIGATWSPASGSFGETAKTYMETTYGNDVILLNIQSGDLISAPSDFGPKFGNAFLNFVGTPPIPHAFWSAHAFPFTHRMFAPNPIVNNNAANADISAILAKIPQVGIGATATIAGNIITVKTKVTFYNATNMPHNIGVYLLEDGIMANQQLNAAPPQTTEHNNVLRIASNGSNGILGLNPMGNSFVPNQIIEGVYSLTADNSWNASKFQVAVVVWEGNSPDRISNAVLINVD